MQRQTPDLWLLVQLGLATVFGTALLYLLGMLGIALVGGAGFAAFGVLAFVPTVVMLAVVVCVGAAIPSWVAFQGAFRGALALGISPRAALHPSLAIVTLVASIGLSWSLDLFGNGPIIYLAIFGGVPQIALWAALRLLLDGPVGVEAEQ